MEKDMKKGFKNFNKVILLIVASILIVVFSVFIYEKQQREADVLKLKNEDLSLVNRVIKLINNNKDNITVPTIWVALIHDVVSWGHVTLADAGLTEKELQQMAENSRNRSYANCKECKKSQFLTDKLRRYHMEYIEAMSDGKFKWTEPMTWPKYAHLINDTPEHWVLSSKKVPKKAMAYTKEQAKERGFLTATKISLNMGENKYTPFGLEEGRYASFDSGNACIVILPDDSQQTGKILFKGIYMDGSSSVVVARSANGKKYVFFDAPPQGGRLKVIAYMLTDEEMKNQKQ